MTTVFADTLYWVANIKPGDPWKEAAERARSSLGTVRVLTTDEVLIEVLAAFAKGDKHLRRLAAKTVWAILDNPNVRVLAQSRDSFLRGVELYEKRLDKEYSLTDCISMNAMRSESVTGILTNDHHFKQEGFEILIRKQQG
ncbi:MAG: type II toxin-antitoxin system VapC family toxin [Planctomycetota bacterium]|jgi:predicted nucleic acid-binding protein